MCRGEREGNTAGGYTMWLFPQECGTHMRVGSGRDLAWSCSVPNKQLPLFTHVPKPTFDVIREDALNSNQYING